MTFYENNSHRVQLEYFEDVSRHKSLVGNLVHLLWAPGQVGTDDKRPLWVQANTNSQIFKHSDVACPAGVHHPGLAAASNRRRDPCLSRSPPLSNHS